MSLIEHIIYEINIERRSGYYRNINNGIQTGFKTVNK
jgi:hypothetical protein